MSEKCRLGLIAAEKPELWHRWQPVAGDSTFSTDIFVKDMTTGAVTRVSTSGAGGEGDGDNFLPVFSTHHPNRTW